MLHVVRFAAVWCVKTKMFCRPCTDVVCWAVESLIVQSKACMVLYIIVIWSIVIEPLSDDGAGYFKPFETFNMYIKTPFDCVCAACHIHVQAVSVQ